MVKTPAARLPIHARLARPRHDLLEVLVSVRVGEALAEMLRGVVGYVKQEQLNWQVRCVDADEFAQQIRRGPIDAAIASLRPEQSEAIETVARRRMRIVNVLHDLEPAVPSVLSDDVVIGRLAAQYFLRRGFRSFAFLGTVSNWSEARLRGFTEAIEQSGLNGSAILNEKLVLHSRTIQSARSARRRHAWLESLPRQTAILACSDHVASVLLADAMTLHRSVPEDLAVLGVDNLTPTCDLTAIPLSSVPQDFPRIGFEAARLLHAQLLQKPRELGPLLIPASAVVVRRSTDCLVFDDPHVSSAMRLIHQRAHVGLPMKELLRFVPVSRRWLDARFKSLIGHTPAEEIRRLRLEHIRRLLVQTDLSVKEIAMRCGFSYGENMDRFFREAYGAPPAVYRKQTALAQV